MHILLINANPVVSRLLTLCTRNAEIILEETEDITLVKRKQYDIIFVDEESYKDDVLQLDSYIDTNKKVLFSNEDVVISAFDTTIKKPFLPSQIMSLLKNIEDNDGKVIAEEPQVLDGGEIEKIKSLLYMDEEDDILEKLSEDDIEIRKIKVIKEQLIADGLEIIDEDKIVEELSGKETISPKIKTENITKKKKKKKKVFEYSKQELEKIEDAIEMTIATLKRKQMKKLLKGKKVDVVVQISGFNS